jgi:hypothetical protein
MTPIVVILTKETFFQYRPTDWKGLPLARVPAQCVVETDQSNFCIYPTDISISYLMVLR